MNLSKNVITIISLVLFITACNNKKEKAADTMNHQIEMGNDNHDEMSQITEGHDNSDGHHDSDTDHATTARDITTSTKKNTATTPIIDAYLSIKNGLVADDEGAAKDGAQSLLTAFSIFDMSSLEGEAYSEYMEILESSKEHAAHIIKSEIGHQREHFESLSTDITDLISLLGTEKTLYQDYCPMKKVSWISETEAIKNPYYGSEMLTCGNVEKQYN